MRFLYLFLFISATVSAQTDITTETLEREVDRLYAQRNASTPGAQVLVLRDGEVLLQKNYGLANLEHRVRVSDKTVFDLASIAKMFTGYAVATLAEAGHIDVDAEVQRYLPEFPVYDQAVTVSHLLHHTSGLRNWTTLIRNASWSTTDRLTTQNLLRLIYAQEGLDFPPGSRYQYCNSGYVLLAEIIERVSGTPFPEWMANNVFLPLEMDNTRFNDHPANIIPGLAQGYYQDNEREEARDFNNTAALGSSSLISNAEDMRKWATFLLQPPAAKRAIVDRMLSTEPLADGAVNTYAYGIDVDEYRDTPYISHSGSWASQTSYLLLLPERDIAIFLAHNYQTYTNYLAKKIADLFLFGGQTTSRSIADDDQDAPINVSTDQLDQYTGLYELGPGWYLNIIREGGRLFTKSTAEPRFIMEPATDSSFVVPAYGYRMITFSRAADGAVDTLIYDGIRAGRQPATIFNSDLDEVAPYLGTYYSHELGLVFRFAHESGRLQATNVRTGPMVLSQLAGDTYFADGLLDRIIFNRAPDGEVTGFSMTNSRKERQWTFYKTE